MGRHIGNYEIITNLGRGSFGKVKKARHVKTGTYVAIKIMDKVKMKKREMKTRVKTEIEVMTRIKHPNVVSLIEVLASKNKVFMVLELVEGGDLLRQLIKVSRFKECEARKIFKQLCAALSHCHSIGICHRDLKPENVLLDKAGIVKIADFGLSSTFDEEAENHVLATSCGTPSYVAPEVLLKKAYDGPKADIWSLGIILYVLLEGKLPFEAVNIQGLMKKMSTCILEFPLPLTSSAKELIISIIRVDPKQRISLMEIEKHIWCAEDMKETNMNISIEQVPRENSHKKNVPKQTPSILRKNSRSLKSESNNKQQQGSSPILCNVASAFDVINCSASKALSNIVNNCNLKLQCLGRGDPAGIMQSIVSHFKKHPATVQNIVIRRELALIIAILKFGLERVTLNIELKLLAKENKLFLIILEKAHGDYGAFIKACHLVKPLTSSIIAA